MDQVSIGLCVSMILEYVRNIYIRLRTDKIRCFCLGELMKSFALSFLFFPFTSFLYMYVCMVHCYAFENLGFRAGMYIYIDVYLCIYIDMYLIVLRERLLIIRRWV